MNLEADSKIFHELSEQIIVKFTGKLNLQHKTTHQHIGKLYLKNGELIHAQLGKLLGFKAFYQLLINELEGEIHEFVYEPELVDGSIQTINLNFNQLLERSTVTLKLYQDSLQLKPPGDLKITLDPKIFQPGEEITSTEFDLMCTICEWSKVSDIYAHSLLLEYEITIGLAALKKKGALRIFQSV